MRKGLLSASVALTVAAAVSGCGSSTANEGQSSQATGSFAAAVQARFPAKQHLAEASQLVIQVTNLSARAMPNVAVTLTNPKYGNSAQALGTLLAQPAPGQPILAGRSRPVWVIDQSPGACGYACRVGGDGGAGTTAYTNTWALGSLAPRATKTFAWHVTALQSGSYTVAYKVAAGLSGNATATGASTAGQLRVEISAKPREGYINAAGKPVEQN